MRFFPIEADHEGAVPEDAGEVILVDICRTNCKQLHIMYRNFILLIYDIVY